MPRKQKVQNSIPVPIVPVPTVEVEVEVNVAKKTVKKVKKNQSPKVKKTKVATGFALFVKQNYESVKDLENSKRLKALSVKYREMKNNNVDKK